MLGSIISALADIIINIDTEGGNTSVTVFNDSHDNDDDPWYW